MQNSIKSMRVSFVQQPGNYSSIYVLLSSLKFSETEPKVLIFWLKSQKHIYLNSLQAATEVNSNTLIWLQWEQKQTL